MSSFRGPVGVIDCGTNSIRLLILDRSRTEVVRRARLTRLGENVDRDGLLADEAMERSLAVMTEYAAELRIHEVEGVRVVATSAVRDAMNGLAFLEEVEKIVGSRPDLLSGEDEAILSYRGALVGLSRPLARCVCVVDIGGGSTEIAVGAGTTVRAVSTDLGCVRLTERYFRSDPPLGNEVEAAIAAIQGRLAEQADPIVIPSVTAGDECQLVGVSGTVVSLACLELGQPASDWKLANATELTVSAVEEWSSVLLSESAADRLRRTAILPGREDILPAGSLILREIMRRYRLPSCRIATADILDGAVAEMVEGEA